MLVEPKGSIGLYNISDVDKHHHTPDGMSGAEHHHINPGPDPTPSEENVRLFFLPTVNVQDTTDNSFQFVQVKADRGEA